LILFGFMVFYKIDLNRSIFATDGMTEKRYFSGIRLILTARDCWKSGKGIVREG